MVVPPRFARGPYSFKGSWTAIIPWNIQAGTPSGGRTHVTRIKSAVHNRSAIGASKNGGASKDRTRSVRFSVCFAH